jgi:hypothetical protein
VFPWSEETMRPKKPHTTGEGDLFRARIDQIINMKHERVGAAVLRSPPKPRLSANYARPCFRDRRADGFSTSLIGRSFSLLQAPTQERSCKHRQRRCLWQQNEILRLSRPFGKSLMGPALPFPDETCIVISPSKPQPWVGCPQFFFMAV